MAILKAGNFEMEIRFQKFFSYSSSGGCFEYSFEPRIDGQPLVNSSLNKEYCANGRYVSYYVWSTEGLIPFFETLIQTKKDAKWDDSPYYDVIIKAKTPQSQRERTKEARTHKKNLGDGF